VTTIYYLDSPGCPFFSQELKDAPMGAQLERLEELKGGGLIRRIYDVKARTYPKNGSTLEPSLVIAQFAYAELMSENNSSLQRKMERQRQANQLLEKRNTMLADRNRELTAELTHYRQLNVAIIKFRAATKS
jgi:hypothetical protein